MSAMLLLSRCLLAAIFAIAGISKLLDRSGSRKSLLDFGTPALLVPALSIALPLVELACAVALVLGPWVPVGGLGALILLGTFIAAIGVNLARGRHPECHCFGQLHSSPAGFGALVRNAVLALMAGFVALSQPETSVSSALAGVTRLEGMLILLAVGLGGLALLSAAALYAVLRQNGRILLRIDAIEKTLGMDAEPREVVGQTPPSVGLAPGVFAPDFQVRDLDGAAVTLERLKGRSRRLLLVFTEPECGSCDALMPDLAFWQREHAERVLLVPISRGEVGVNRAKGIRHNLDGMLLQRDREVSRAYALDSVPAAVLVTDGLVASATARGAEAIRHLVGEATAPEPLRRGDVVPPLKLRGLDGGLSDLPYPGRSRLLLFWNPSCGFCQSLLDDVKAWESDRPADSPELVVVAAGSRQANRAHGFRSPVLLDPKLEVNALFGAGGTPSAVIVGGDGRVASDVAVGAEEVLDLAGAAPAMVRG